MANKEADGNDIIQFRTLHSVLSYNFKWYVESYLELVYSCSLETSKFHPIADRRFSATFVKSDSDYCYLKFELESGPDVLIEHEGSVADSSGSLTSTINLEPRKHLYKTETDNGSCSFQISTSELDKLVMASNDNVFVLNTTMQIILVKTEEVPLENTASDQDKLLALSANFSILTDDFKTMFCDSKHTDFTLYAKDEYVNAHKSVLSARSPVFDKLLHKQINELTISDIELPVLKGLLEFLYTGKVSNEDFDSVLQLYHAAYQYEVDSLQSTCVHILLSKLDISNACRVLVHADKHLNEKFKSLVIEFIQLHYDEIKVTNVFTQFVKEYPSLAVEVMQGRIEMCKRD